MTIDELIEAGKGYSGTGLSNDPSYAGGERITAAKLRKYAEIKKHTIATWQLLSKAADEIERLQKRIAELEK